MGAPGTQVSRQQAASQKLASLQSRVAAKDLVNEIPFFPFCCWYWGMWRCRLEQPRLWNIYVLFFKMAVNWCLVWNYKLQKKNMLRFSWHSALVALKFLPSPGWPDGKIFLKVTLTLWDLFFFHTNLRVICSYYEKKNHWYFDRDWIISSILDSMVI